METQESCMIVAEFILKLMTGLLPTEEAQHALVFLLARHRWLPLAGLVGYSTNRWQLLLLELFPVHSYAYSWRSLVARGGPFLGRSQQCLLLNRNIATDDIVDIWQLKWLATSLGHCLLAICRLLLGFHQPVIVAYSK